MPSTTTCPGCGLVLPAVGIAGDPAANASQECLFVYGEVAGFELQHLAALGRFHQLAVDSYGGQHAGGDARSIRVAYSVVGLHLYFEKARSGPQVRAAHSRMGRPQPWWPPFEKPAEVGTVHVLEVARLGSRADDVEGHARAMHLWGESVWETWRSHHAAIADLSRRLLGEGY